MEERGWGVAMATGAERHQHCISISGNGARESKVWCRTKLGRKWIRTPSVRGGAWAARLG